MTDTQPVASLYHGKVVHKRFSPLRHQLSYRVFSMLLPLNDIDEICSRTWCLSRNHFNLVSFHDLDHGARDGSCAEAFVTKAMRSAGIDTRACNLYVLCYPRLLGYSFNPLTTYYAISADGEVVAMMYEVSNTFGEHTHYLVRHGRMQNGTLAQSCEKAFHVSPFNKPDGDYGFRITRPGKTACVGVSLRRGGKEVLNAYFHGRRTLLTSHTLFMAVARQPLMTWKVIAGIHYEALKLWMKGLKLHRKPVFGGLKVHESGISEK